MKCNYLWSELNCKEDLIHSQVITSSLEILFHLISQQLLDMSEAFSSMVFNPQ